MTERVNAMEAVPGRIYRVKTWNDQWHYAYCYWKERHPHLSKERVPVWVNAATKKQLDSFVSIVEEVDVAHELKTIPPFFGDVETWMKDFEVRKHDRPFMLGDVIRLREYDPETESYTGRDLLVSVKYMLLGGQFGIEKGYCVMGFTRLRYMGPVNDDVPINSPRLAEE